MAAIASSAAAPKAPSRPDPHRRVLDAAITCFTRNGFHGTSMHEICAEAGMSPGGLYRYFPSKDAIIIAIVEEERAARASLMACLEQAPGFVAGLVAMGDALFSGAVPMACVELAPEISAEAARNPVLKAKFDEVEAEMEEVIRRAFVAAQARGEVDPALDPDLALVMINAIGDGLLLRSRLEPDLPLATLMPLLGELIARMLAPPAAPPSSDLTR
ncbi:TetR/AcrR family transcriptional regulator [Ancylobacter sp. MQZ15Z-1]|uniref:TetR/AcrR family transcriptional regulator n=1 Tax=Ancylobacter mangrovi TaxID=2972472 RepID=A0A9X2PJN2_9HYPH|nr:TetR/AcrR family transcriptional regulator [Ancylobacter mangrovi]MCS0495208.1 TetR/AcrR family transcriptional regulator [Ancylobacter mangrovi]